MEPVSKQSLYQQVLERLLGAISNGEFPPGSQLPSERELMTMIGVGRPSIREALLSLQQMGLIRISHGERARVVRPTPATIVDQLSNAMIVLLLTSEHGLEELKQTRVWLEEGLVRKACATARAGDLEQLETALEAMRQSRFNTSAFVEADMAFHVHIAQMSRNSLVVAATRGMLDWLSRFKRDYVSVPGAEALSIEEHERILESIRAGNGDAAAEAMRDHLERANDLYRQTGSGTGHEEH